MIKLKAPLNWKGRMFEVGEVVSLPPEFESKMVEAGTAERFIPGAIKSEQKPELKPNPEPEPEPELESNQKPEPEIESQKKKSKKSGK